MKFMKFKTPLIEALIIKRRNRFISEVLLNNEIIDCYMPTTGKIGNIKIENISCLLSESDNDKRKTKFTVEAISLNKPLTKNKEWIGINQQAANRYVEYFLENSSLKDMFPEKSLTIKREAKLLSSKIDFKVNDTYLEVKTPLKELQINYPKHIELLKTTNAVSADRMIKQLGDITSNLKKNERAILLVCFIYNNPGFKPKITTKDNKKANKIKDSVLLAELKGLEQWQINFKITKEGIYLKKYFKL